ncbi:hypothetical protein DI43_09970 [Geobacillus sp. CAMR12739]|nr:hypothetical protein DI43_09970 [Geobacillus sp. CAMR12739]
MTTMLTLTTTPIEVTDGVESLLGPLKKMRVPVHELALMMAISLRFIPTLMEETEKIMKAQAARGVEFFWRPFFRTDESHCLTACASVYQLVQTSR